MEILIYIIPFAVFSPVLIIGIIKFRNLFGYRKANLEKTEAKIKKTDYDSMWQHARAGISYTTYGYKKVGTYVFTVDDKEYEFTYSSDRDHGFLPDTITACYPKGRPQKAFAEGNTPFIKEFFHAFMWCFVYLVISATALTVILTFPDSYGNYIPSDSADLLSVWVPDDKPDNRYEDFMIDTSLSIYKLDEKEKSEIEAEISSSDKWTPYVDSDKEVILTFNTVFFNSAAEPEIEPDIENCYIAFYDTGADYPDLPTPGFEEISYDIVFSPVILAVYDMTDSTYYYIETLKGI